jgi:hypothetical protein
MRFLDFDAECLYRERLLRREVEKSRGEPRKAPKEKQRLSLHVAL